MPTVAIVNGVRIQFYRDEHPPEHFHARVAEHTAQIEIGTLQVLKGSLPRSKLKDVTEWAVERKPELKAAWAAMRSGKKPGKIV